MRIINRLSTKDLIAESMKMTERQNGKVLQENAAAENHKKTILEQNQGIFDAQKSRTARQQARAAFCESVKSNLLSECIFKVYKESFGIELKNDYSTSMRRNLVNQFIKENGVENILRQFRTGTELQAEFAYLVDTTYKKIVESFDANDPDCMLNADFAKIDPQLTDDFFDRLDDEDTSTASAAIKQRVADAITEFIDQNTVDKQDIKDVLNAAQEKIDNTSDKNLQESYQQIATRKVTDIRGRKKNVFGAMVQAMGEAVLKSDVLKTEFMHEGSLDMDLIVERVTTLYTFVETLNTLKAITVNEEYINDLVESLRSVD